MIIIIPTIKYGSTYYNTFTMGVCSNYHGYFFQCTISKSFCCEEAKIDQNFSFCFLIFRKILKNEGNVTDFGYFCNKILNRTKIL